MDRIVSVIPVKDLKALEVVNLEGVVRAGVGKMTQKLRILAWPTPCKPIIH